MKDRKNGRNVRQQGNSASHYQWQQSQHISHEDRDQKSSIKNQKQPNSAHRTQQR